MAQTVIGRRVSRGGMARFHDMKPRFVTALLLLPVLLILWRGGGFAAAIVLFFGAVMLAEAFGIVKNGAQQKGGLRLREILAVLVMGCALALTIIGSIALALTAPRLLLLAAVIITAADVAAFMAGRSIGGARLAPAISPGKTWSGAVGGLAGGMIAAIPAGAVILPGFDWQAGFWQTVFDWQTGFLQTMAFLGGVVTLLSMAGDLTESWFKRVFGAKDSGTILPGHGGVLDRFDGYLFAIPALWLALYAGGFPP